MTTPCPSGNGPLRRGTRLLLAAGGVGCREASGGSLGQTWVGLGWKPRLYLVSCVGQDLGEGPQT